MTISQTIKKPNHLRHSKQHDLVRSVRLVNFESGELATIMPNLGATVMELVLKSRKKLYPILEAPSSLQDIIENPHYHGAKLFPFPGRIPNGKYMFGGARFSLQRNSSDGSSSIHGFISRKPFRIVRTTADDKQASVMLEYIHGGETRGYPFKFCIRIKYILSRGSLRCTTVVRNMDSRSMPLGDGWHPYFKTSGKINSLLLSLPPHSVVKLSDQKVPNGQIKDGPRKASIIALRQKRLDSVFDLGIRRRVRTTKLIDRKLGLELRLWQDAGKGKYRYLVVYRPPSGSSVAIEPWTCPPNALNNGMGLIVLKPGGTFKASYGVRLAPSR